VQQAERYEMKPLFHGVCKCQKWVENANQTQLKLIIWYTSWYFSRWGGKNFTPPPYRIHINAPAGNLVKKSLKIGTRWKEMTQWELLPPRYTGILLLNYAYKVCESKAKNSQVVLLQSKTLERCIFHQYQPYIKLKDDLTNLL